MPIYEYKCNNCGKVFAELLKNLKEEDSLECPHCGSKNFKKLISKSSFILEGGGWSTGAEAQMMDHTKKLI